VQIRAVPVTISHAACDLTGVALSYKKFGGAVVPKTATNISNSGGFTLEIDPASRDVTVSAKGDHGQL